MHWGNQFATVDPEIRFLTNIRMAGDCDCWPWTGCVNKQTGYGIFSVGKKNILAHRFAYQIWIGDIPSGMTIDHQCHTHNLMCPGGLCHHRLCVNPAHLKIVPRGINTLIGRTISARNLEKERCPAGHSYDETNTYWYGSRRSCRECHRDRERVRRALARARRFAA